VRRINNNSSSSSSSSKNNNIIIRLFLCLDLFRTCLAVTIIRCCDGVGCCHSHSTHSSI